MKYEKDFDKWWVNLPYIPTPKNSFMDLENAKLGWNAAIEFMNSRNCNDCKYYYNCNKLYCTKIGGYKEKDFCCNSWEAKG